MLRDRRIYSWGERTASDYAADPRRTPVSTDDTDPDEIGNEAEDLHFYGGRYGILTDLRSVPESTRARLRSIAGRYL